MRAGRLHAGRRWPTERLARLQRCSPRGRVARQRPLSAERTGPRLRLRQLHGADRETPDIRWSAVDTDADLVAYSRDYAESAVATRPYRLASLDVVAEWSVSGRAKRRAAVVRHPRVPDAEVGTPLDWEAVRRAHGDRLPGSGSRFGDLRECHVVCSRRAAEAYDEAEWRRVLRHELVHVEQFARFGATGHGAWFRERADAVDADRHCPAFHRGRYVVRCRACGDVLADRCRRCRTTELASLPPAEQRDRLAPTDCCGALYDLEDTRAGGDARADGETGRGNAGAS